MTDRMSNVEIEDVLSSIRRLVSDELRPMPPLRQSAARLVLTQALRVDPLPRPVAEPEALAFQSMRNPVAEPAVTEAADPPELALRLAELELLLDAQDQPFEAESFEDLAELPVTGWTAEPVVEAPFITDEDPVGLADLPDTPLPDWREAAEAGTRLDPEQDFSGESDLTETVTRYAAPQAGGAPADAEIDDDGDLDAAVAAVDARAYAEQEYDAEAEGEFADTAALRELIREVLREELQGALGERVTRNLRKMVRGELARALAARGLT